MYETNYHLAGNVQEAATLFAGASEPRYLAGGQTLIPTMKQRLAAPSDLIDISRLAELKGIAASGDVVTIGAATTHAEVERSDAVRGAIPALSVLAGLIGDPAVRHRGTLGGSLANNDPAADYPAAVLALDARVTTTRREIAAGAFFTGMFATALEPGEIVTEVSFKVPSRAGYAKFPNPASRYARVGRFVAALGDGIRVAVAGAAPCVFRAPEMESALRTSFRPDAVAAVSISPQGLNADLFGSAEYRAHLVSVMAKRAVGAALG